MNRKSESVETPEPMAAQAGRAPLLAYLGLIAATVFWASNAVAVKLIVRELPYATAAGLRIGLAALTLAVLYVARGGRFHLRPVEVWQFLTLGFWGLALSFLFFTIGVYYTSVSHAVLVGALVPVAVLLLARMDGQERISYGKLGGMLVSLLGVFLLALDKASGPGPSWQGDLIVGAAVCSFAFFTVKSKRMAAAYDTLYFNTCCFLMAAICFLPWLGWTLPRLPWGHITWVGWSSLLYSATVGSAGAYLAYYYSLRRMKASEAAVFQYLQPVLAILLGVWFFQESLTPRFEVAAALILTGVFLAERQ
ncbi:MAG TPA: DMT family transporter [Candidatus Glassbacteria bacterium]|nr:DMT family transporter [Candidatus Glassbacteria bacterium]